MLPVSARPSRRASVTTVIAFAVTTAVIVCAAVVSAAPARAAGPVTVTFGAVGTHTWTVPAAVTSLQLSLAGGEGGTAPVNPAPGGRGATVAATVAVTPGDTVDVVVAGAGSSDGTGGVGGGGRGGSDDAAGGGGASRITVAGTLVAVAAGGGGGTRFSGSGGDSGSAAPAAPRTTAGGGGEAGTPAAGGTGGQGGDGSAWPSCTADTSGTPGADGSLGQGGAGGDGLSYGGGGGGGGRYGGGGGGSGSVCTSRGVTDTGGGGGGGSSFVAPSATGTSIDDGAHSGDGVVTITYVDATAPTAAPTVTPAAHAAGWHAGDVTVDWHWTDDGAGVDPTACTQTTSSTGEGVLDLTTTCADLAGNTASATVTVKVDLSDPTVTVTAPTDGASFRVGDSVVAGYSCDDAVSGIDSCTGTVADGDALDTSTAGSHSFIVTATDVAGRTTVHTVTYMVTAPPAAAPQDPAVAPAVLAATGAVPSAPLGGLAVALLVSGLLLRTVAWPSRRAHLRRH